MAPYFNARAVHGKAQRMSALRSFFGDLIEWEWIHAGIDPKSVLSRPLSIRAQMGPNPRIIDDVARRSSWRPGLHSTLKI